LIINSDASVVTVTPDFKHIVIFALFIKPENAPTSAPNDSPSSNESIVFVKTNVGEFVRGSVKNTVCKLDAKFKNT
jgi:hypothetical protein